MPNFPRATLPLGLVAGCLAALALPTPSPAAAVDDAPALRTGGPAELAAMLARYDRLPAGDARERLALQIDAVAGQRYATVSRLYWHTDLERAKEAARTTQRPILALRMLGRLDEDLSCANSRLFRATLYADAEISTFLRNHFVLYWSSERPVPRVTIDFGDGRKLQRTTTGNSAHYVLDEHGRVLDVVPGLYAPVVFKAELGKSLQLASQVRHLARDARVDAIVAFHEAGRIAADKAVGAVGGTSYVRGKRRLLASGELGAGALAAAQQATMMKARLEVVELARLGFDAGTIDAADVGQWAALGQQVWRIGGPSARTQGRGAATAVLDDRSQALVAQLHTAGDPAARRGVPEMFARLEQHIVADTALNELRLRQQIRAYLIERRELGLEAVNAWVYTNVFHTPRSDTWLGLLPRTDFSGLPGDGVLMP